MVYTNLGDTEEKISVVGFGGWAIGGHGYGDVDDSRSIVAINKAFDVGINLFDTADVYGFGHSEQVLGKALGSRIKNAIVATKFGVRWDDSGKTLKDCSPPYLRKALEGTLKRLKTDCIPLYQLHCHDGVTPLSDVFESLFRLQEEGKIRNIGVSNIPNPVFGNEKISDRIVSAQLQYSMVFQHSLNDLVAYRRRNRMATLVYGVLARGSLSGKYQKGHVFGERDTRGVDTDFLEIMNRNERIMEEVIKLSAKYRKTPSQIAIRWVLDDSAVSCALVGIKSEEQVVENAGAVGWHLEKEDRDRLGSLGEGT